MSTSKPTIHYDSSEAAQHKTVTGWVSASGRFWGDDERMARYDGATHRNCTTDGCGTLIEINSLYCPACLGLRRVAKYNAMTKVGWDDTTPLYSDSRQIYFMSRSDLIDHLREHPEDTVDSLQLIICDPNEASELDPAEIFSDEVPEDGEVPNELAEAFEALNAVIRACPPLSWSPGSEAAIVTIDPAELL